MDKLLTVILLHLSLIPILATLIVTYVVLIRYIRIRWVVVPTALRFTWLAIRRIGVIWTLFCIIFILLYNVWEDWPLSGVYWAYMLELSDWIRTWCLILIPSIPTLVEFYEFILLAHPPEKKQIEVYVILGALGVMVLTLMLVTPFIVLDALW